MRSICFLAVDQCRITNIAINSIVNVKGADRKGVAFVGAPVPVISGAGVVVMAAPEYQFLTTN
ncbi:MAG: hypothetical protein WA130_17110 [Candidatus Methanoperedens sp.]